jgi:hypothetical protein
MSSVKYELGFYIPEDAILHSHQRENIKSYVDLRRLLGATCHAILSFPELFVAILVNE